ncbi:MAG: hypothetical protein EZS28_053214, partial [Streblomastix strix]
VFFKEIQIKDFQLKMH